jgi:hypothetical protein
VNVNFVAFVRMKMIFGRNVEISFALLIGDSMTADEDAVNFKFSFRNSRDQPSTIFYFYDSSSVLKFLSFEYY